MGKVNTYSPEEKTVSEDPTVSRRKDNYLLLIISAASFLVLYLLNFTPGYGYFRDELYYIVCTKHLAFGYVDHPPLSIFVLYIWRVIFGDALASIRFLAAISGAATVFFIGLIARRFGGNKFSQGLACLSIMAAPLFLGINSFYSMNTLEMLLWTICTYFIIRLLQTNDLRYWIAIGAAIGLGLLNKHTMIVYAFGLFAGLLLTKERRHFKSKWLWYGVLIAFIILLPNIIWQAMNSFPSLEFYRNADLYKNVPTPPLRVFIMQILSMQPFTFPIWLAGLYFVMAREKKTYSLIGWGYLVMLLIVMVSGSSRPDRLSAAYPALLAAGSVYVSFMIYESQRLWLRPVILIALFFGGLLTAPVTTTILPPEANAKYIAALGFSPQFEKGKKAALPQLLADRIGWEKFASDVAKAYNTLTPEEKAGSVIITGNYGEAGALEIRKEKYGFPKVMSGHNSYFLWGLNTPTPKVVIALAYRKETLEKYFDKVNEAGIYSADYIMGYENNMPIYIAKGPKVSLSEVWPSIKHYE